MYIGIETIRQKRMKERDKDSSSNRDVDRQRERDRGYRIEGAKTGASESDK